MKDKIIFKLLGSLNKDTPTSDDLIISLILIAWWKKSRNPNVTDELKIKNCRGVNATELKAIFSKICSITHDSAFSDEVCSKVTNIRHEILGVAIDECITLGESSVLDNYNPTDVISVMSPYKDMDLFEIILPKELAGLLVDLSGDIDGKKVYLPWETGSQLTGRILDKGADAFIESSSIMSLPNLIASILDKKIISSTHNDPLKNPTNVENGKLTKFPITISHIPFWNTVVAEVADDIYEQDLFERFEEKTRSMTVLSIRHVLAQTQGRAIITIHNTLLFGSGYERRLREFLLNEQHIEAIIALPSNLLLRTPIPFSILILNTEKKCESVRFINADTKEFSEPITGIKNGRIKNRLINVEKLVANVFSELPCEFYRDVPTQEILANDAQLQVGRYILSKQEEKVENKLSEMKRIPLDEIATLIKPIIGINSEEGISVREVGAYDIPDYGYIRTASKDLKVNIKNKKIKEQFLRPNDIVLITKGNAGKVGLIPKDIPEDSWLAGHTSAVIRLDKDSPIDPRALVMLLRSQLGEGLLKTIISEGTMPFIQLRELERLNIPIPTEEESQNAIAILEEEVKLQQEITELQGHLKELSMECWKINP
jgi:type I restriction enzyme M protein